jgi:hypothetical protein
MSHERHDPETGCALAILVGLLVCAAIVCAVVIVVSNL